MIDRITINEERLDNILVSVKNLENALDNFKKNLNDFEKINKYYGSKTWFKDKESYEKEEIPHIKAGVLSEDAIWNMDEEVAELIVEMEKVIKKIKKTKK